MRVTCLKCGSQYDVEYDTSAVAVNCECGPSISYPEVHYAGVVPSERAAEKLRYRAFHSAGLVRNVGVIALTFSVVSVLFFPLAIVGVAIGIYTLVGTRGPLKKYVGRQQAIAAIALGAVVFLAEGALALKFMEQREVRRVNALQASVKDDLRGLLRTQRLFRAAQDRYGTFSDFPGRGFKPISGHYTIYLGDNEFISALRYDAEFKDEWDGSVRAGVSADEFTAIAVANLDSDPEVDVWMLSHTGEQTHLVNDNDHLIEESATPEKGGGPDSAPAAPAVAERAKPAEPAPTEPSPIKPSLEEPPVKPEGGEPRSEEPAATPVKIVPPSPPKSPASGQNAGMPQPSTTPKPAAPVESPQGEPTPPKVAPPEPVAPAPEEPQPSEGIEPAALEPAAPVPAEPPSDDATPSSPEEPASPEPGVPPETVADSDQG